MKDSLNSIKRQIKNTRRKPMEFINDMLGLKVSIKDASTYSKISEKDYIQMLKEGYYDQS